MGCAGECSQSLALKQVPAEVIDDFVMMIKSFPKHAAKKNAYDVAFHVGKQTNLVKELFNDKSTEGVATI